MEKSENKQKKLIFIITVFALALLCAASLLFFCIYSLCTRPTTVTISNTPDYSHITEDSFISLFCDIETDLEMLDTSAVGKTAVSLKLFGFLQATSEVNITEPSLPDLIKQDVWITCGYNITPDKFILDNEGLDCRFIDQTFDINTPGEYSVRISASRNGGIPTEFSSKLTVIDPEKDFTFEYGTISDSIVKTINFKYLDIDTVDTSNVGPTGVFTVKCRSESTLYLFDITLLSQSARGEKVLSYDLILGETLTKEDIIRGIDDSSGITAEVSQLPDFTKAGDHKVFVRLTNSEGNIEEYTSNIRIHNINKAITAEMLSSNEDIAKLIFCDDISPSQLRFGKDFVCEYFMPGENRIFLSGEFSTVTVTAHITDTQAPVITLKNIKKALGHMPDASDLIESCQDATRVTYSFENDPDCNTEGSSYVTVVASDSSGNKTKAKAKITFVRDKTPPVIHGADDLTLLIGQSAHYSKGVYAKDDLDGTVSVAVDSTKVNINKLGKYPIYYSAVDSSGNETTVTYYIYVSDNIEVCLDVENIMQYPELPNGCEITSLAIVLNYLGYEVDNVWLCDNHLPIEDFIYGNPWKTYVGNPKNEGLGCYAPAIVEAGNSYLGSVNSSYKTKNISGTDFHSFTEYIDRGIPVIVWGTMYMNCDPEVYWTRVYDGEEVVWHASSHCLVLIGYTKDTYIFCDPMRGGTVEYSRESVEESYEINFRQACIVH